MSTRDFSGEEKTSNKKAVQLTGASFMTLSFLSLIVIPKLKLSDRGLFDWERYLFEG